MDWPFALFFTAVVAVLGFNDWHEQSLKHERNMARIAAHCACDDVEATPTQGAEP